MTSGKSSEGCSKVHTMKHENWNRTRKSNCSQCTNDEYESHSELKKDMLMAGQVSSMSSSIDF